MRAFRFVTVVLFGALIGSAGAQVVPPPLTATLINFDELVGLPTDVFSIPGPASTEYTSRGLTFSGFGQNGGGLADIGDFANPAISNPNIMVFFSALPMQNGGLLALPETLSFYPTITSLQFDLSSAGLGCDPPEILKVEGFAPGGASLGVQTVTVPGAEEGITVLLSFPPPGAERVVLSSIQICANLADIFTLDNIAFVTVPTGASRCVQSTLDAAGKKAKAVASCYAKAVQKGVGVDATCLQKASDAFAKSFTKAQALGDCPLETDEATVESAVDTFVASAVQMVTGGAPGPDICSDKKLVAVGKKAQSMSKCFSTAAKSGAAADPACGAKAGKSFNSSLKKCGTQGQLGPVENLVDQFANDLSRTLTVPTTTTTTTTTSTTTTTTAPPLGQHLSFTTTVGTANCGSAGFGTPADPPFSGELDDGTMKLVDLGLGCLYIGGGASTITASNIPENATTILDSSDGMNLTASFGTGPRDCSRGPEATRHCVNDPTLACTNDIECGGLSGACAADANCFFGPPVPVNGFPASCVVNTFASDANGTLDLTTGASSVNITLASRVFLTLGQPSTCPQCVDGACNWGTTPGAPCTTSNTALSTLDCVPGPSLFVATLPIDLSPLTTGTNTVTAADGLFCPGQTSAGAFGQPTTQVISQTGTPSGDLTDGLPHASVLVSNFCIPLTGNTALDTIADLPGPGSLSLSGNAQFLASPSGAFLAE